MPESPLDRKDETVPLWATVVVNYNAGPLIVECVRSLLEDRSAGPGEIVVVDNNSTDGSPDLLEREVAGTGVTVIRTGVNLGYAKAANRGIAATSADVIAVLNPDATVHPGTAAAMLARFDRDDRLGAVGPLVEDPDGTVYPSARALPSTFDAVGHGLLLLFWPTNPFTRRYRQLGADPSSCREVDWVSGAAIWLRRQALDEIGGWDERYFMYVEDVDLCWQLRQAGWRIAYEPSGRVVHLRAASTSRVPYRMIAEHHRSLWKFAERRWQGPRRVLLAPAAGFLAFRSGLAMGHHLAIARCASRRARLTPHG